MYLFVYRNAMNFTVEHCLSIGGNTQDEVDCSMYTSASDNDHLVKEISKLEVEKRQHEQEVEQLKVHNKKLVDSHEMLEKKLDSLAEEKMAEVQKLEKQIEYMANEQSKSEKSAMEEKLIISNELEEKNEEMLRLKTNLDLAHKELETCKFLIDNKEKLLQEQMIEFKKQELKITELLEIQDLMVKEKNALLDSHARDIAELTNNLKVSTENVENERSQRCKADAEKENLEEHLERLKVDLVQVNETCELLKSKLEKYEKDKLDQLKSVHEEKNLEVSRVESEMHQQLLELRSTISTLKDDKIQLTNENDSLNDRASKLKYEMEEKNVRISSLELTLADLNHKLHDSAEQNYVMERNYKDQLANKEQIVAELTILRESLNEKLQAEASKLKKSEQKLDKLTTLLKEHKENEKQLKEKIAKLETDIEENNKEMDTLTLQLKDAEEKIVSTDQVQLEKISQYENKILLVQEINDSLTSQLKEYKEKSEMQTKNITQYMSDISLLNKTNDKELKEKEVVIVEKQRTIEKLEEQKSVLGMSI